MKFYRTVCGPFEGSPQTDVWLNYLDCATWKQFHPDDTSPDCDSSGTYGGENFHVFATPQWCRSWGLNQDQCGWEFTYIHINKTRWQGKVSRGETYWPARLIIHELGHTVGLNDYCAADAAMNNSLGGCNGGKWAGITSWTAIDRDGVFHSSHRVTHPH